MELSTVGRETYPGWQVPLWFNPQESFVVSSQKLGVGQGCPRLSLLAVCVTNSANGGMA